MSCAHEPTSFPAESEFRVQMIGLWGAFQPERNDIFMKTRQKKERKKRNQSDHSRRALWGVFKST